MTEPTIFWVPQFLAGLTSIIMAFSLWPKRSAPGARALMVLMLATAEWALLSALHKVSPDLATKVLLAKIQYVGIVTVPPALLIFVLQYTGRETWLTVRNFVLMLIFPVLTLALVWTNQIHGLVWKKIWLDTSGLIPIGVYDYGPCFWAWISFCYLTVLLSAALLIQALSSSPRFYRTQVFIVLMGIAAPCIANVLHIINISPWPRIDLTPIAFTVTGLVVGCAIYLFRILDIVPVAHKAVLNSMPDGVIVLDHHGRIVDINPAAQEIFCLSDPGIIGQSALQVFVNQSMLIKQVNEVTEQRSEITLGEGDAQRFYDLYISPLKDRYGSFIGRLITLRDFTQRKRGEVALLESEERLRIAGEVAYDLIYEWSVKDDKLEWFGNIDEILGYEVDKIPRTIDGWLNQIHPKDASRLKDAVELHRTSSAPISYEYRIMHKDGTWRHWSSHGMPVLDEEGLPHKWIGVCTDITDRVRAEKALRESEERYRDLFDSIGDFIYSHDLEGRLLAVNRATADGLGYARQELIGRLVSDFILPDYRAAFKEVYLPQIKEKGSFDGVSVYLSRDGKEHYIEHRNVLVRQGGEEPFVSGAGRDITERVLAQQELRKLEDQLRQAEKMEAIGTLAGGIAHDFNNLLTAIQGNVSLMLLTKDSSDPDYVRLKNIEEYVQNGAELTRELLDFAKGGKYEVRPTDLNELVRKNSEMFGRTRKEIGIHPKYQKDIWAVEVDRTQIGQVLMNLYINAWQAMPGGGKLFIETENIDLGPHDVKPYGVVPGKYVKISVTDTGVGMDEKTQERIFDPFFTTKEMGRGTGLGLASAYGIIKNHGGIINVQSTKGEGTTFTLYLPASEKEVIQEKKLSEEVLGGRETILFVDDEEKIIDSGKEMLQEMGYTVVTAKSGRQAIDIYREKAGEIALVILDVIMPEMGGGETYDRLKKLNPEIKVLLSSGYSKDGEATEMLKRGCNGYIQKPFNIKEISYKIREIFDKDPEEK